MPFYDDSLIARVLSDERIGLVMFAYLSPREFLAISKTCKVGRRAVTAYMDKAFDIDFRLSRFFSDTRSFRTMQAQTSTLISGSFALQFFDRTFYESSDLDLYAHFHQRRIVGAWLLQAGYTFSPFYDQPVDFAVAVLRKTPPRNMRYSMPGVADIFTFLKRGADRGAPLKVQIIVARRTPMEVILGFHSTLVMNVISYELAYCLFPLATVESRRSLLSWSSQGRSTRRQEGIEKYKKRHFQIEQALSSAEVLSPIRKTPFTLGPRWVGDGDTWVIPLSTKHIANHPPPLNPYSLPLLHDPIRVASFSVRYHPTDGAIMTFSVLRSLALKYAYVLGDEGLVDHLRCTLAFKETANLATLVAGLDDFPFYDTELPRICREYIQRSMEKKLLYLQERHSTKVPMM